MVGSMRATLRNPHIGFYGVRKRCTTRGETSCAPVLIPKDLRTQIMSFMCKIPSLF